MNQKLREIFGDDADILASLDRQEQLALLKRLTSFGGIDSNQVLTIVKGEKGEVGPEPSDERLVELIKPLIPDPIPGKDGYTPRKGIDYFEGKHGKDGKDGRDGKDGAMGPRGIPGKDGEDGKDGDSANFDDDELYKKFVDRIIKEQPIDISQIRNAQSFMFKNTRYKFEELMHGGGGSGSSTPNISTEVVTAVASGENVTIDLTQLSQPYVGVLFVTRNGQILLPNGSADIPGSSWSQSGDIITVYNATDGDSYQVQYSY